MAKPQTAELAALGSKLETKPLPGVEADFVDARIRLEVQKTDNVEQFLLKWAQAAETWGKGAVWGMKVFDITLPSGAGSSPSGKLVDVSVRFMVYNKIALAEVLKHWFANKGTYDMANVIAMTVLGVTKVALDTLPEDADVWMKDFKAPKEGNYDHLVPSDTNLKSMFT